MTQGNRLGEAVSPYLLQHKDNPVHWREWSPEALGEAAERDCPILLSVGYAACHWCHVMAHESFEDVGTAAVMNRLFVNVKVDREERPDIDHLYMTALHAMGEQGGWPMTMFLTPKGEPFFGGTYYPKRASHGRPGFVDLLQAVAKAWSEKRANLQTSADGLAAQLETFLSRAGGGAGEIDPNGIREAASRIGTMIDPRLGGMKGAPKFPNAPYLEVLARSAFPNGPAEHREGFLVTLRGLCEGGIHDHLGGGLHRYSVDERWLVPHFEKMLYDNAQFLRHLVWGWRATGEALFRARIEETVGWLEREMRVEGGGLAASLDADSLDEAGHMEEGAFYVWREAEIDAALGDRAAAFKAVYDVTPGGNWEGRTILNRLWGSGGTDEDFLAEKAALLAARDARPRPGRDDKVLADWNGLAIRALAEAAMATGEERALRQARDAFRFVEERMIVDGRLHHAARQGRLSGVALASDYGAMIAAAAALFTATLDPGYLEAGKRLAEALDRWHGDGDGGHFMTASDAGDVLLRLRGDHDDAVPGSTAQVLEGLALLAQVSGDLEIAALAEKAASLAAGRISDSASAYPGILAAFDRLANGSELGIVGYRSNPGCAEMVAVARDSVDLNRVDFLIKDPSALPETLALADSTPAQYPAAYLCRNRACRPPVYDAGALQAMLGGGA